MKKTSIILFILFSIIASYGQEKKSNEHKFSPFYYHKVSHFRTLPNTKGEIIFLGNSITDYCEWSELFQNSKIKNRGISGDVTDGVLERLDEVTESKPSKIFLMIGINDLSRGKSEEYIFNNQELLGDVYEFDPHKNNLLRNNPKRGIGFDEVQQIWGHP